MSLLVMLLVGPLTWADVNFSSKEDTELTVYNQDVALIKERRKLSLQKGLNRISLEEVAAQIDPTSVHFTSLTAPDTVRILEQNYEFDLVNYGKLLEKYIGKEIEIHEVADQKTGEVRVKKARLLSSGYNPQPQPMGFGMRPVYTYLSTGQPLFDIDGKIYTQANGTIVLPSLAEGLILKPTLSWQLDSGQAGLHATELTYMTGGINWLADYVVLLDVSDTQLDLTGWVTIDNRSGATYPDAKLKLMAGEVHMAQPPPGVYALEAVRRGMPQSAAAPPFQEKSFFEYHLYTLQRPTTIKDNEIKQIELVQGLKVPVKKQYVYDGFPTNPQSQGLDIGSYRYQSDYGTEGTTKVSVMLEFENAEANHLGIPLPKGRVRIYKHDEGGGQEFVGEDVIDHTPKDETVKLSVGDAFDLVGERKQIDFKVLDPNHMVEESFEITLRNHKKEDATITVRERLYRGREWEIKSPSLPYTKKDVQTIEFSVPVVKDGQAKLTYTVRYRW